MTGYDVHIVGSVPLDGAAAVFEAVGGVLSGELNHKGVLKAR